MKLQEAIELLEDLKNGCGTEMAEYILACNLGIEALKYAQRDHRGLSPAEIERLPGETDETEEARPPREKA